MSGFDAGLQPERTALAWRRTALSVAVGGLVSLRLLPPILGAWSFAVGVVVVAASVGLAVLSERRFRRAYARFVADDHLPTGGTLALLLASVIALTALVGLAYVIGVAVTGRTLL